MDFGYLQNRVLLFQRCFKEGTFLSLREKANIALYKKDEENFVINHRQASSLSIRSKVLERLKRNPIYEFLLKKFNI